MNTYTSDSRGYMLFKDGQPIGGAGTIARAWEKKKRHWRHVRADVKMFSEAGKREAAKLNAATVPA